MTAACKRAQMTGDKRRACGSQQPRQASTTDSTSARAQAARIEAVWPSGPPAGINRCDTDRGSETNRRAPVVDVERTRHPIRFG